jgi:hypothetical protein
MPHLCAQGAAHAARRRRSHDDLSSCAMCTPRSRRSTAAPSCCSGGCRTRRPARSPTDPPRAGSSAGDGCTGLAGEGGAHASTAGATAARRPLRGGGSGGVGGGGAQEHTSEVSLRVLSPIQRSTRASLSDARSPPPSSAAASSSPVSIPSAIARRRARADSCRASQPRSQICRYGQFC